MIEYIFRVSCIYLMQCMIYKIKPHSFSPRFEVVSCFVEFEGSILLLHRLPQKSQGGRWGVPAGKIDSGEQPKGALLREIQEETGLYLSADSINYFDKVYVNHQGYDFTYYMFHIVLLLMPNITLSKSEHQAYCWQLPKMALSLPLVDDLDSCIAMFYGDRLNV